MPIDKNKIENNNETNFLNIKIVLSVLLTSSIIGGLRYYFLANKKPSKELIQEVTEDNQETEDNNQTNNEENIENKEEENQPEIIVNNEYIPVIDNLWLNIPTFLIIQILTICKKEIIFDVIKDSKIEKLIFNFFEKIAMGKEKISNFLNFTFYTLVWQLFSYIIWFILILIFAAFSKIWDKEHSWWSNVKKGFFRNRIHRGWLLLIPISLLIIVTIINFSKINNN